MMLSNSTGIFSSKLLTRSSSTVLLAGQHCGDLSLGGFDTSSSMSTFPRPVLQYVTQDAIQAFRWASQCYGQQSDLCDTFIVPALPYDIDRNASCPFDDKICRAANNNLLLDTGAIDSKAHLGFNAGPHFTLHYQTHCAPLETEGYTSTDQSNSSSPTILYNYSKDGYTFWSTPPQDLSMSPDVAAHYDVL
jgi:hypothetical protein